MSIRKPTPGFQQGTSNWIGTSEQWQDQRKDTVRVDYRIGDKTNLAVRATHIPFHFNTVLGSTRFVELWSRPNRTAVATAQRVTLSATFLNEFTVSASSDGLGEANSDPDCGARCRRSTYGVSYPFLFPADSKFDPEKLPTLSINGLSTLDNGPYPGYWSGFTYAVSNNMTKVVNTHTLKWGIFVERSGQDDQIHATTASAPATNNQNGAFRFLDTGHPQATGLAMANVLLGNFNDYSEFGAKPKTPFVGTAVRLVRAGQLEERARSSRWKRVFAIRIWQPWHSKWNTLSMFHPDFYDPAQAAVVDPAGGFIVSGDRYNGIVLPGDAPTRRGAEPTFRFFEDFTSCITDCRQGSRRLTRTGFPAAGGPRLQHRPEDDRSRRRRQVLQSNRHQPRSGARWAAAVHGAVHGHQRQRGCARRRAAAGCSPLPSPRRRPR